MESCEALANTLVFVPKRVDGDVSVHNAVTSKLTSLGARLASRYGKDVTHIVYLKKLLPSPQEQAQQDSNLRDLYEKIGKVKLAFAHEVSGQTCTCAHADPFLCGHHAG